MKYLILDVKKGTFVWCSTDDMKVVVEDHVRSACSDNIRICEVTHMARIEVDVKTSIRPKWEDI